ncbi:MAG: hypothetical protein ACYDIA_10300 [Candidatus Humimicrobiaceae bacterium]
MGIFSSQIEKDLEKIYIPLLSSVAPNEKEAKRTFNQLLTQSKIKCKKAGITENEKWSESFIGLMNSTNIPLGEIEKRRKDYIDIRKNEGVTDPDIRSWWDLHYLERAFIEELDNFFKMMSHLISRDQGLSVEETAKRTRHAFIIYGQPNDISHTTGDNRPLPFELKDRINRYVEKRTKENLTTFKNEIENYDTYNAFIRSEIRKGNI